MSIDSINAISANPTANNAIQNNVDQMDFLKLFLQELNYQDPTKPVDNKEFMAQMAQFSALQEARQTRTGVENLQKMLMANQALSLVGRMVELSVDKEKPYQVASVSFVDGDPVLNLSSDNQKVLTAKLSDISRVYGSNK
ncbi:flagellar hook assembly protein FlgD [Cysteiniphilum litorale]|uniref:flagellar hook assembly protein FlgD n=1 Tax=Cysteiniphilum litorale TaxID=2056700 RepID=UPI003F880B0A